MFPLCSGSSSRARRASEGFSTRYIADPAQEIVPYALRRNPELWDVVMLKYGILNQTMAKEGMPLAAEHNVGVLNMASVRIKLPVPALLEELIAEWKDKGYIGRDSVPAQDPHWAGWCMAMWTRW